MTNIKQHIAQEAARIVDGARRGAYGTPERNFERICLLWNAYIEAKYGQRLAGFALTPSDISPMMRLMKEARIIESPKHYDSHVDLVGYTLTGAEVNQVTAPEAAPAQTSSSDDPVMQWRAFHRQDGG
jgi:hypothetical protein